MKDQARIVKYNILKNKRIIAISDIHGHYTFLRELLKKTEFSDNDELFLCGDYIERGTENLKALRYVMELSQKSNVHILCGNVDAWRVSVIEDDAESCEETFEYIKHKVEYYGTCTITEMCDEIGVKITCAEDVKKAKELIKVHFRRELDFIRSLPTVIETQNFTFVHGGLKSAIVADAAAVTAGELTKFDGFLNTTLNFDKYVIVGHWPTSLYRTFPDCSPLILRDKKIIDIDGGCGVKKYGQLNALIIPHFNSQEFYYESYDDFPLITAQNSAEESTEFLNIKWINNKIEILEKGQTFTKIRHIAENKVGFVPTEFIYESSDGFHCKDYTDYRIMVNKGEKLKLIKEYPFGLFVKKGSVFGWYYK